MRRTLLAIALLYAGCFESSGFGTEDDGFVEAPVATTENEYCVELINGYRAKVGAAPLKRSSAVEAYANAGAAADAKSGRAHGHFSDTSGGGIAWAENEVPGWPGNVRDVITESLKMMWDEGPGGGHHDNMASKKWTEVGCGIFVTSSGKVWVTQDFR